MKKNITTSFQSDHVKMESDDMYMYVEPDSKISGIRFQNFCAGTHVKIESGDILEPDFKIMYRA